MGKITAIAHDYHLSAVERFKEALKALSRQDNQRVVQLTASCPVLAGKELDRAFTERLRGAERLTHFVAADLGLALARYAIVDDLTRSLSVMGKVVHEELRMAWELGHQSASADVIPEVDLSTLLSQHDTVWTQGQADQYAARDHWGQYAHSLWSAWESFTREAWQVSPDVPFRAWLPICRVDDELLQPIKTLKNIAPETESREAYRTLLERTWQQTINLIS